MRPSNDRIFSADEAREILDAAIETQFRNTEGFTLGELIGAGREVGVPRSAIEAAAVQLISRQAQAKDSPPLWRRSITLAGVGLGLAIGSEYVVPGMLGRHPTYLPQLALALGLVGTGGLAFASRRIGRLRSQIQFHILNASLWGPFLGALWAISKTVGLPALSGLERVFEFGHALAAFGVISGIGGFVTLIGTWRSQIAPTEPGRPSSGFKKALAGRLKRLVDYVLSRQAEALRVSRRPRRRIREFVDVQLHITG